MLDRVVVLCVFFFKQKTAYEMRISDWSSDVCSSDLRDKKGRKQNFLQSTYRETVGELRKVSWPTWPEARRLTGLVLLVMVFMGLILGSIDWLARDRKSVV